MAELTPLEDALRTVLENVKPLDTEKVFIYDALGRFLARDITSDTDKPLFNNSAMDGFAVRYEDIKEASEEKPAQLKLVGEFAAGTGENLKVGEGMAVKIFTGAPIPEGADTVVPVEYTETKNGVVYIKRAFKKGANIRLKGEDVREGEVILRKGQEIRGYEVGMLAFVNRAVIEVYRRPQVAVLSTGDELLELGEPQSRASQIRSSNHHMVYSLIESAGGVPHQLGIAPDKPEELLKVLKTCHRYDIFITTGGVSMGEKDYVQYLVREVGVDVKFHKLRIKPAKPVLFGTYGENKLFFGLPGNPVSCAVAFDLLVYPAIRTMLGAKEVFKKKLKAVLTKDFSRRDASRREFARAKVWFEGERALCEPHPKQQSHMLTSLVESNAYMIVPEDVKEIKNGEPVEVVLL
ncbi:molybdopterin molybdotransferase [Hydrogenivirga caldilitoris]|uniref:Molybdopterin molybdenumtransferase n=1 Tax=Hydrogenivirga caldilitoris TaxID=246264 RepID=A0A497XNE0_9AQUI|nr:gephyrin-like molybdotransferase Glp [Hydrogenivirga caldilitoris]RLJ69771.1 molybdopterin molybdotransferase [Hydrogenivirga caldilitoris]